MLPRFIVCCVTLVLLLSACRGYDFTLNEKVVYRAAPLFTDFDIPDEALRNCLKQAIIDANITAAAQLSNLNCSNAGIANLEGLATFTALTRLKLAGNGIRNLLELPALELLEILQLADNRVIDPVPLYTLSALRALDLSGNDALQCPAHGALAQLESLQLPSHCRREQAE